MKDEAFIRGAIPMTKTESGWGHAGVRAGICLGYENQQLLQDRADRLLHVQAEGLVSVILEKEWSDTTYEG